MALSLVGSARAANGRSASRSSSADEMRFAGFRAKQFSTIDARPTGNAGRKSSTEGIPALRTRSHVAATLGLANKRLPVNISNKTTPNDQRLVRPSTPTEPRSRSGARYPGDPSLQHTPWPRLLGAFQPPGNAKIHDTEARGAGALRRHEQIGWLDVTVDQADAVSLLETARRLHRISRGHVRGEGAAVLHHHAQVRAFQPLHHEVRQTCLQAPRAERLHDMVAAQRRRHASFVLEASQIARYSPASSGRST